MSAALLRTSLQALPWEFSDSSKTIPTAVSLGEFIDQLLLISLEEKKQAVWFFEETKRVNSCLIHCSQRKMNNKHSQVLLVFRKSPRKWNYEGSSVLKTCPALIVDISERIYCFNEVFLMALTSTEQLFIERLLHRRFLHNDYLPSQQTFVLIKTSFVFVFRRRLADVLKTSWSRRICLP